MRRKSIIILTALTPVVLASQPGKEHIIDYEPTETDLYIDSICFSDLLKLPYHEFNNHWDHLTESDYIEVAQELGVEVPAIKAVVDIETGRTHKGFWQKGKALINFDIDIYKQYAKHHGVNLSEAKKKQPLIFQKPDVKKHGSQQAAQYARFEAALQVHHDLAIESCFWGMFQIGGFNWKICGCRNVDEFHKRVNTSEREQLELFAAYCRSRGLVKYIQAKDWSNFSLRYNGPGYKKRGYHKKMDAAYKKFKSRK